MESETRLEQERKQIVEAMDWIDAERKRLSRFCFSETRKKWHGEHERGRRITLMKKQGEWLYRRRCRLRERIGQVNSALKEMRRARSGRASEGFGSAFVEAAREKLPEDVFAELMDEATRRVGDLRGRRRGAEGGAADDRPRRPQAGPGGVHGVERAGAWQGAGEAPGDAGRLRDRREGRQEDLRGRRGVGGGSLAAAATTCHHPALHRQAWSSSAWVFGFGGSLRPDLRLASEREW